MFFSFFGLLVSPWPPTCYVRQYWKHKHHHFRLHCFMITITTTLLISWSDWWLIAIGHPDVTLRCVSTEVDSDLTLRRGRSLWSAPSCQPHSEWVRVLPGLVWMRPDSCSKQMWMLRMWQHLQVALFQGFTKCHPRFFSLIITHILQMVTCNIDISIVFWPDLAGLVHDPLWKHVPVATQWFHFYISCILLQFLPVIKVETMLMLSSASLQKMTHKRQEI